MNNYLKSALTILSALILGLAACSPRPEKTEKAPPESEAEKALAHEVIRSPDTTGAYVWTFIQDSNYRGTWKTWPGKGKFYEGRRPHGALLTTYLNPLALGAVNTKAGKMPDGATIVKENYEADSTLSSITVMRKFAGYNPDHDDWFFTKFSPSGEVEHGPEGMALEGRVPMCESCHSEQKDNDYLFTAPIR